MSNPVPQNNECQQKILARCLTVTAGYLDGYGLLVLGTYVSFMSGNTSMAGVRIGQANLMAAVSPAVAIASFVAGSFAGNLITHSQLRHAQRVLFAVIAALLLISFGLGSDNMFKNINIGLLSASMGLVNPALSQIGAETVSLTFVTGTLSRLATHLALALKGAPVPSSQGPWDTHLHRARIDAMLWASFIIGAILSGILISSIKAFALLPVIAVMVLLILWSIAGSIRSNFRQAPVLR